MNLRILDKPSQLCVKAKNRRLGVNGFVSIWDQIYGTMSLIFVHVGH